MGCETLVNKELSQNQCKKLASKIEEQRTLIDERLGLSISNAIDENTAMRNNINEEIAEFLTKHVENCITKARREIK